MQTRRYQPDLDFAMLNEWLVGHKMSEIAAEDLPITGVVLEDDGELIAMGFLRLVEGRMGIIESVVTNPILGMLKRARAVDALIGSERDDSGTIMGIAKQINIKYLMVTSNKSGTISRTINQYGFTKSDQTLLVKCI